MGVTLKLATQGIVGVNFFLGQEVDTDAAVVPTELAIGTAHAFIGDTDITINLPNPATTTQDIPHGISGSVIKIKNLLDEDPVNPGFTSGTITIAANGNNVDGRTDDVINNVQNFTATFVYVNDSLGWVAY